MIFRTTILSEDLAILFAITPQSFHYIVDIPMVCFNPGGFLCAHLFLNNSNCLLLG